MRPAQARESNTRLHQTFGTVNQCRRVCVEKCFLTMAHAATRSGDSCGSERPRTYVRPERLQRFGGIATRKPNEAELRARSHPRSGPQRERTRAGWRREREQRERPSSGASNFHARGVGESGACWSNSQRTTRSTWSSARMKHVGLHVDVSSKQRSSRGRRRREKNPKSNSNSRRKGESQQQAKRAKPTAGKIRASSQDETSRRASSWLRR